MLQGICFENAGKTAADEPPAPFRRLDWTLRPVEAACGLAHLPGLLWLDSALPGQGAVSILSAAPERVLSGHLERDWHQVEACLRRRSLARHPGWPMPAGGLFGWVGYDGRFVLGRYPGLLVYRHEDDGWFGAGDVAALVRHQACRPMRLHLPEFRPLIERDAFLHMVRQAKAYIAAGDIYQVNLSYPWKAPWPDPTCSLEAYLRLRAISPAPQAAYLDLAGTQVLSASPELFLRLSGDQIVTRPIKGTRPRFPDDSARDAAARSELLASAKERAELLMITDLERNDLGQVCEFGSVRTPELWRVEAYPQVFHLVSTVQGRLAPGVSHAHAFRACFPGGSITGAPKRRAREIIRELEPHPRGLYTGAIGGFGFNGESFWNIAIRTAVSAGGTLHFHSGAGIVADSDPEAEYEETRHKAAGLLALSRP